MSGREQHQAGGHNAGFQVHDLLSGLFGASTRASRCLIAPEFSKFHVMD
jgi:hypothetical protein